MDSEIEAALIDVRKAFRLLCLYQRRVLDLVREIEASFDGMSFYCWTPVGTDRPPNLTTSPLEDRWSWDFLLLYWVTFLFLPSGADPNRPRAGQWMLDISVQSDDGFPANCTQRAEPDPIAFREAEKCKSLIWLYAFAVSRDYDVNWYHDIWSETDYPPQDQKSATSKDGVKVVGERYELSALTTHESLQAAISDFKALLSREGIGSGP